LSRSMATASSFLLSSTVTPSWSRKVTTCPRASGWQFSPRGRIPAETRPEITGDGEQNPPAGEAGRSPET
jgi:hypothetical protein